MQVTVLGIKQTVGAICFDVKFRLNKSGFQTLFDLSMSSFAAKIICRKSVYIKNDLRSSSN